MYLYKKLTMMAALLLYLAFLTQSRHIPNRRSADSHDEDVCPPKNVTMSAASCFISQDLTSRLSATLATLITTKNNEIDNVLRLPDASTFYDQWYDPWYVHHRNVNCNTWTISYLLAEAKSSFEEDIVSIRKRTVTRTENMNDLKNPVETVLQDVHCEVKSILENCPLLSGFPISDISMETTDEQPWIEDTSTDFMVAKFWVVWHTKMHWIHTKAAELTAIEIGDTDRSDCSHTICVN